MRRLLCARMMVLLLATWLAPAWSTPAPTETAAGNTRFAFELYAKLARQPGNIAFSPFSISTALAMTLAGARGETAAEMVAVLHVPEQQAQEAFGALLSKFSQPHPSYKLNMANRIWPSISLNLSQTFLDLLKTHYGATLLAVDFSQVERARKQINDWVAQQTQGKICDLIPSGMLDSSTALVLTNAIYFQGSWRQPFWLKDTRPGDFTSADGTVTRCQLMNGAGPMRYAESDTCQILEMPYRGDRLAMIVVLPRTSQAMAELQKSLDCTHWEEWTGQLSEAIVRVTLPRFKVDAQLRLSKTLRELGMVRLFGSQADLSGLVESQEPLSIAECLHQATVEVNEEGTEAAAATAVIATRSMPATFVADHAFVFAIRDEQTGTLLFLGRVDHP